MGVSSAIAWKASRRAEDVAVYRHESNDVHCRPGEVERLDFVDGRTDLGARKLAILRLIQRRQNRCPNFWTSGEGQPAAHLRQLFTFDREFI